MSLASQVSALASRVATEIKSVRAVVNTKADATTTYAVINYNTSTKAWPLRSTVTSDLTRPVRWRGPAAPPTSSGYAITGVDEWLVTS